jgi:hypothetical protein
MKYATLRLSKKNDHGAYFDLKFKLLENSFVPKWIDRVLEAQQNQYPISEPWAMYNLNASMNHEFIKDNLNRLMREVDSVEELFGIQIESVNDQDTLNKIHSIFEKHHGKLDEWKNNPLFKDKPNDFRKNLSEINQFVHACESSNVQKKIRVVWFDLPKTKTFSDKDYKLFTNQRSFGSLYHLYTDVGKNIESLAVDKDEHHHDVVPNIHYSADCTIFFYDRSEQQVQEEERKQKDYLQRNQHYLKSKGYEVGDPRLTTGAIEIGKLESELSRDEILEELKKYNHIQSFFLS